jgi:hypothetical protein
MLVLLFLALSFYVEARYGEAGTLLNSRRVLPLPKHLQEILMKNRIHHDVPQVYGSDLPTNFDGRKQWPKCIHPILDQVGYVRSFG